MVRVRSPGDPRLATPSRRTALPVYLDAISAPRRGALLGLFSDLSRARYALSRRTPGPGRAVAGARFSGARPLRIRGLRIAEGSRDYRGIYDIAWGTLTLILRPTLHCMTMSSARLCVCVVMCVTVSLHAASMILNHQYSSSMYNENFELSICTCKFYFVYCLLNGYTW